MSERGSQDQPDDVLVDLLVKQVTEGLSSAEQRALEAFDAATTADDLREFERAAAAVSLLSVSAAALPAGLRQRVEQQAQSVFGASKSSVAAPAGSSSANGGGATVVDFKDSRSPAVAPPRAGAAVSRGAGRSRFAGWYAAAACLVLALFGWLRPQSAVTPVADVQVAVAPAVVAPPVVPDAPSTPADERAKLLAQEGSLKVTLGATKDPAAVGVSGDVVWDPVTQKGYLHFVGLAPNDPAVHQYQIWIFDGARDKRFPVDAGVFDVPADVAEVVIPINASLLIHKPAAFAVTLEKAGGVVVSTRNHVLALGAAG